MKKEYVVFIFLVLLLLLLSVLFPETLSEKGRQGPQACFEKHCFTVEIADTFLKQTRGLMFREKLEEGTGMLFVYSKEQDLVFWMKNMQIPLDMIFLDKDKKIVSIHKNVQPCLTKNCPGIGPNKKAQYVLEINIGNADKIGLRPGDKMTLKPE